MIRLILIFAITFIMVMDAGAQDRRRGGGDGRGGGWSQGGGGHHRGYNRPAPRYYHAQRPGYRYRSGYGWYDPGSAIIGGAIGGWLWRQFNDPPPPQVVVVPQEPIRDVAWCMNRYRSYNPSTRTYLGYDGQYHACP